MKTIIKLAFRNLLEHRSKSIIIGLFLIFGIAIVVMGNSFLEAVNRGLEKDFRTNYSGDIAITPLPKKGDSIDIFGVTTTDLSDPFPTIPALPELSKIEEILSSRDEVKQSTKLISAQVMISKDTEYDFTALSELDSVGFDDLPIAIVFSGEEDTYWEMFKNVNLIEGTYPKKDTNELLLDTRVKKIYENLFKQEIHVGDKLTLVAAGPAGIFREGVVCGFCTPANQNSAMFQIIYANPDLARVFANLTYANTVEEEFGDAIDFSISSLDEDAMFEDIFDSDMDVLSAKQTDYNSILGDTTLRDKMNQADSGAWNFILLKLKNPDKANKVISALNAEFKKNNIAVTALDWKAACKSYTGTVEGIGFIFNLMIFILGLVVFIIIMNTMTVSVLERTSEIGTMRAIGTEKQFVKKLFFAESTVLTLISSVAGIILALILMLIFNSFEITVTNSIAKMILGGGLVHFSPTVKILIATIIVSLACSFLSTIYPVNSALKVSPLKALSKE